MYELSEYQHFLLHNAANTATQIVAIFVPTLDDPPYSRAWGAYRLHELGDLVRMGLFREALGDHTCVRIFGITPTGFDMFNSAGQRPPV